MKMDTNNLRQLKILATDMFVISIIIKTTSVPHKIVTSKSLKMSGHKGFNESLLFLV